MAKFILFGDIKVLSSIVREYSPWLMDSDKIHLSHAVDSKEACEFAVNCVKNKEADILMKGNIPTSTF